MKKIFSRVRQTGRATLITILGISLIVVAGGFYFATNQAQALALTSVRATLTNSAPSATSSWTIQFVTPTLINENDTIVLNFDTLGTLDQFTISPTITFADLDLAEDTDGTPGSCSGTLTDETLAAVADGITWGAAFATSTDTLTLTAPTGAGTYIAASACVIIEIGSIAISGGTGDDFITNPAKVAAAGTADIYDVAISFTGNAASDSGSVLVAVIEGVTVSVSIDESLNFSIAGVASSSCTQGGTATAITTTTSTVPFGTSGLTAETFYKGCHDLTAGTNGAGGYTISTQENNSLLSAANTLNDTTCDSADCTEVIATSTTAAWATATVNGFGYTCSGSQCNSQFATASEFNSFPCTGTDALCDPGNGADAAQQPISNSSPTASQTNRIVYKLSFDTVQEAGDYTNTITYIATPTF
ncbi:MAG: hypothetical protein Q7R62_01225 [bacterium]|nr:hypothetical protein [bacterium]